MTDTLFLQFYSRIGNTNPRFKGQSIYDACNGFSDTYDLCKSKGDFIWINHSKELKGYGQNEHINKDIVLPINKGTIYVSIYYISHLYQVYKWANRYPDIKFICGGPSANNKNFIIDSSLIPSNLILIEDTVEEYFGVPNFSYPWKLELPDEDHSMSLSYTYTLRSLCYWGKCIFCNYSQGKRERPKINFEFLDVNYSGHQRINLYTPSMTSSQLKSLFYELEYDKNKRYDIYLRGNKTETETLQKIFENRKTKFPQTKFFIGVEFPSEKMLKYMNKNTSIEGILNTINMISNYSHDGIQIALPFILGWNNLDLNDLLSLDSFLNKLPYDKVKITFSVNMLSAKPYTKIFNEYEIQKELYIGPFLYGFMPKISKEQLGYTKQAIEILANKGVTVFDYHNIRGM